MHPLNSSHPSFESQSSPDGLDPCLTTGTQAGAELPHPMTETAAAAAVLRAAKKLHKSACSDSLSQSLPVLRRILATGVVQDMSLPLLFERRSMLQRKHVLRMLALEAGHSSWQQYSQELASQSAQALQQLDVLAPGLGYPNLWFADLEQAQAHALVHGGRVVAVKTAQGTQAAVLPDAAH